MTNVINEGSLHGLTRIEISYHADCKEAVDEIYSGLFLDNYKTDLKIFESCINQASGICHMVPLKDLLHTFD